MKIVRAKPRQAEELSELALRSKAIWGYDSVFLKACKQELTYTTAQLESRKWQFWIATSPVESLIHNPKYLNQVKLNGFVALEFTDSKFIEINALFICPESINKGLGRALFQKALEQAEAVEASQILVHSDPNAVPFYQKMGFITISSVASGSIEGRTIPLMQRRLL
ncbi:MAG: N-acetylglutamate synthase-like GNAT family acetyltransferase [Glaciecola sp.]